MKKTKNIKEPNEIAFKDIVGFTAMPHTHHKGYFWIFKGNVRVGSYSTRQRVADIHIAKRWDTTTCVSLHQAMCWIFLKLQKPLK